MEHDADPNARHPYYKETALDWAIRRERRGETVSLLIEHGADVNAQLPTGKTSSLSDDKTDDVGTALIGYTPYELAVRVGDTVVVDLLLQHGAGKFPDTTVSRCRHKR